jgi:hypothetical protein
VAGLKRWLQLDPAAVFVAAVYGEAVYATTTGCEAPLVACFAISAAASNRSW